jgi:hypothetical protein
MSRASPTLVPTPAALLQPGSDATALLAAALRAALDSSGLFYESHLAEWVEGRRPLDSLTREPQAGLRAAPEPSGPLAGAERTIATPTGGADRATATLAVEHLEQPVARTAPGPTAAPAGAAPEAEQPVIHPHALPLVRDQLQTLENGQLLWTGQAWPGQALEWRLHPLDDEGTRATEEPVPWATRLRLTLPRLGAITADLQLSGSSLRLDLGAVDPKAEAELEAARTALARALSDAGITLVRFATTVQEGGERDG